MKVKALKFELTGRCLSIVLLCACILVQNTAIAETDKNTKPEQTPAVSLQQVETFPALLQAGKLQMADIPDPHRNKQGCIACHTSDQSGSTASNLRNKAIYKTCYNCHSPLFDHSYIHPSEVRPDKKMLAHMDPGMRNQLASSKNIITCTTCHDLALQCKSDFKKQKAINPKFLRNGPYDTRSQSCFLCHDKNQYERLNPHDQIDDKGKLKAEKCRTCHADTVERLEQVTDIDQLRFNATGSLSTMCWGCHPWTPHPGGQFTFFKKKSGPDHLKKPPQKILQRLEKMTEKNNINFPLEPGTGKIFCATCHNVHEKGVIKDPEKAKGAGSRKRLRAQEICTYCHLK